MGKLSTESRHFFSMTYSMKAGTEQILNKYGIRKRHQQSVLVFVNTSRGFSDCSSVGFQHQATMQTLTVLAGMPRKVYVIF